MAYEHLFTLNNNGDSPDTLKREFVAVAEAARALEAALAGVTVHGRNYQTMPDAQAAQREDATQRRDMVLAAQEVLEWAMSGAAHVIRQREGL